MSVRASATLRTDDASHQLVFTREPADPAGLLGREIMLGAGVRLAIDLDRPTTWQRLSVVEWSKRAEPLVSAIVGRSAATASDQAVSGTRMDRAPKGIRVSTDSDQADPWLRVAVIHALDRWLHLPLEQTLLQAELAVATLRAAVSLPPTAEVRDAVIDDALGWARRAAMGVAQAMRDLASQPAAIPLPLQRSFQALVDGFVSLRTRVSGPDAELSTVIDSWRVVLDRLERGRADRRLDPPSVEQPHQPKRSRLARAFSMIDPRHVRARVLQLGDQPELPEIVLSRAPATEEDAVQLQVQAYSRRVDPEIAQRLMARLVHRRSGDAVSFAPLTLLDRPRTRSRPPFFECTMPLFGARLEDVRADVFDALDHSQLAHDGGSDLLHVREAVLALRQRRRRLAKDWLTGQPDASPGSTGPDQPLLAELAAVHLDRAA